MVISLDEKEKRRHEEKVANDRFEAEYLQKVGAGNLEMKGGTFFDSIFAQK